MHKLILSCQLAPGDILMLTAAVRDLHRTYPNQFLTDLRTSCPELWLANPFVTPLRDDDPEVTRLECHYPLIHLSNQGSSHFINGYIQFLNQALNLEIKPTDFRGDIHLTSHEKSALSPITRLTGHDLPYWLIVAGGKYDFTIKWWHFSRYQAVVDHFRDRLLFVQVGHAAHYHPPLHHVLDLRGDSSLREMIKLMYYAEGVLCPVTFFMHLAAAVPQPNEKPGTRPCVVVAGGREPPQWEAYPGHQFIHTVGTLDCCATGGCWRARTTPIGDGDEKDHPDSLCLQVTNGLPRCMDLITPADVIRRIELYLEGQRARELTAPEAAGAKRHLRKSVREQLGI